MIRLSGLAMLVTALVLGPAFSGLEAKEGKPKEKKICRTYKVTGSLTRVQRICRTEEEWRLAQENTKTGVDELQNGASGAPKCVSVIDAACPENSPGAF